MKKVLIYHYVSVMKGARRVKTNEVPSVIYTLYIPMVNVNVTSTVSDNKHLFVPFLSEGNINKFFTIVILKHKLHKVLQFAFIYFL